MPNLVRVRAAWTGSAVVGPAVSTFYFDEAGTGFTNSIGLMWDAIKNYIPTGTVITTEANGDIINPVTGDLVGSWADGTPSSITCTGTGSFIFGTGVRIKWATNGLVNGHRPRGSTFIVPFDASNLTGVSNVNETARTAVTNAAQAVVASTNHVLMVWTRPGPKGPGAASAVVNGSCPDAVTWLRSRRT